MKANFEVITNNLNKYDPVIYIFNSDNLFIDNVRYLNRNQTLFEPDILYLGKVSDFFGIPPEVHPTNLILIQDSDLIPNCHNSKGLNIIILNSYPPLDVLYNEIRIMIKHTIKHMQKSLYLYDCLASDQGLKALVDLGSELLGNPIIVVDSTMKILAYSQNNQADELWNGLIKKGFHPYELTKEVKADGVSASFLKSEMPYIYESPDRKKHLGWRLVIAGKVVGYIAVIDSYKTLEDNDTEILAVLCNVVSLELQKNKTFWQTKGMVFDNFINDLLNGELNNNELINERSKYLDIKFSHYLSVIIVEYIVDSNGNIPLPYIRELLESLIFRARCTVYGNQLIMVLSRKRRYPFNPEEKQKLYQFLEENQMIAGVSRSFLDMSRLKNFYGQAVTAIDLGLHLDKQKFLYFYEDYMEYDLIRKAAKSGEVKEICSPMIFELIDYDRDNNSELIKSLFAYLSSGNDLAVAASKIGIHRNSMNYRIRKIEEVLNIKVDDPHLTFSLYLSLKILRFNEKNSSIQPAQPDGQHTIHIFGH